MQTNQFLASAAQTTLGLEAKFCASKQHSQERFRIDKTMVGLSNQPGR
jgi:hypothetical protein